MFSNTKETENKKLFNNICELARNRNKTYNLILRKAIDKSNISPSIEYSINFDKFEIKCRSGLSNCSIEFFIFGPLKRNNENVFGQFLWARLEDSKVDFEGNRYISEDEEKLILDFLDCLYNYNLYSESVLQNYF